GHAPIEESVLREVGRYSADVAVAQRELALRHRITKDEDPRPRLGERNLSDLLIPKAEIVSKELVCVPAPAFDGGAIGLEGVMANRVKDSAIFRPATCHCRPPNRGGAKPVEGEEQCRAENESYQGQCSIQQALAT